MRNRLIHQYDRLDLDVLWQTVSDDLPKLAVSIEAILQTESQEGSRGPG